MFEIEVRPSKVYIIPTVLVAIITIYPICEVIQNQNEASIILLIIMCIALVLIARVAQVNCRTIIFDEEGCRVARGKKNISYAWEEIKIIRKQRREDF